MATKSPLRSSLHLSQLLLVAAILVLWVSSSAPSLAQPIEDQDPGLQSKQNLPVDLPESTARAAEKPCRVHGYPCTKDSRCCSNKCRIVGTANGIRVGSCSPFQTRWNGLSRPTCSKLNDCITENCTAAIIIFVLIINKQFIKLNSIFSMLMMTFFDATSQRWGSCGEGASSI